MWLSLTVGAAQPSLAVARAVGAVVALGEGPTPRCHPLPMGWHRESEA